MVGIARPVVISPAYPDRDAIWSLVTDHAPYPLMAGAAGYGELMGGDVSPWFRANWALDGQAVDEATMSLLHHEPFIAGSKRLFDAEIVRPASLIANLMGPMAEGGVHVDTPTYRGLKRSEVPVWLLVTMGASGLFERWAVRVSGALTWFYDGADGEFEFWQDGRDAPSSTVAAPFGNQALIADNDLMPHRVRAIGNYESFAARTTVSSSSTLSWIGEPGWAVETNGERAGVLARDEVRVSILWKALTFVDAADARRYDDHEDDLDLDTVVTLFREDVARRGTRIDAPADVFGDPVWSGALTSTYMPRR